MRSRSPSSGILGNVARFFGWPSETFRDSLVHTNPSNIFFTKNNAIFYFSLYTSEFFTVLLVKSFTQSVKHSSDNLL